MRVTCLARAARRLVHDPGAIVLHRLLSVMCWSILGTALLLACAQPGMAAEAMLQGSWTAIKAVSDGKSADDVVGHRLLFAGDRFSIQGQDGAALYAGTVRVDPSAKPAAIDFEHEEGALARKTWQGIYVVEGGDTLTICDNAQDLESGRPDRFEAEEGSGYVLITFERLR
jgi:uncharacterized protein (TIGR03067 family)